MQLSEDELMIGHYDLEYLAQEWIMFIKIGFHLNGQKFIFQIKFLGSYRRIRVWREIGTHQRLVFANEMVPNASYFGIESCVQKKELKVYVPLKKILQIYIDLII